MNFTYQLISKFYSNQSTLHFDNYNHTSIDIESQNIIENNYNEYIFNSKKENLLVNDDVNDNANDNINDANDNVNNLVIGSGYDGYNSMFWQRPTKNSDYIVFYKGSKYIISYLDIIKIINSSKNKSYQIEFILKIYIENNFNINLTIIQLVV